MATLAAMFCVFLVIVQTREDMVLIKRVPEISLLELLRQKLMTGNMDYEDDDNSGPKSRASAIRDKVVNTSYPAPRMLHNNPYQNAPDPLFNPYHLTRNNHSHNSHYKSLHNTRYASFHPVPNVVYKTTESPEDSRNPTFLAPKQPAYVQFPQRIHQQSQVIFLPSPKDPFKFNNRVSSYEPHPYPLDVVTDVPLKAPLQQVAVTPQQSLHGNADNPAQYRAYIYRPYKKSTPADTVDTFQTNLKNRERPLIPGKIAYDTDFLFNQQATPPNSMEVWRGEDDVATEKTFRGFQLASGISSIILSSFEEDYNILKTLENTGFVERNPEDVGKQKEVVIIKSNPKIRSTLKKKIADIHPKVINNRNKFNPNTLERKSEIRPTMKVKKREEVDVEALLKKAIKRAEERIRLQPQSFQSYVNGSYPARRTFDRMRWIYPRGLV